MKHIFLFSLKNPQLGLYVNTYRLICMTYKHINKEFEHKLLTYSRLKTFQATLVRRQSVASVTMEIFENQHVLIPGKS